MQQRITHLEKIVKSGEHSKAPNIKLELATNDTSMEYPTPLQQREVKEVVLP